MLERLVVYSVLSAAAKSVTYCGDLTRLKDNLQLVRPTIFIAVPRVFNKFADAIQMKFDAL